MNLPETVGCMDCGYSASEFADVIDGKDKMIFVDAFQTREPPGTVVHMKPKDFEITIAGRSDVPKMHLIELLDEIAISGKCPETLFIGVVPKEIDTFSEELTPEIEAKLPEVIDLVMQEIKLEST